VANDLFTVFAKVVISLPRSYDPDPEPV